MSVKTGFSITRHTVDQNDLRPNYANDYYVRIQLVCIRSYIKSVLRYNIYFCMPSIRTQYIYVSKDVSICGYFSKAKRGARAKEVW